MVVAVLLLVPVSNRVDRVLLAIAHSVRFRWAELNFEERVAARLTRTDDLRGALALRRGAVERAARSGGFPLALASANYGVLLLTGGWTAEGIEYLRLAERMTHGWPSGRMRDLVQLALANGLAARGDVLTAVALVAPAGTRANRGRAEWRAALLNVEATGRVAIGDAAGALEPYRAGLAAAQLSANRDLAAALNNNLAGALTRTGDLGEAEERLAAGESLARAGGPLAAFLAGTRAELELARGDLPAAAAALERSAGLKAAMGAEGGIAWILVTRARLEVASGRLEEASRLLAEAAGRLQDFATLRAWQEEAAAVGKPASASLAPAAPDELLQRIQAFGPASPWSWRLHQGAGYLLALGIGFALFYLGSRYHDQVPGGFQTLTVAYLALVVALFAYIAVRRLPRGRR